MERQMKEPQKVQNQLKERQKVQRQLESDLKAVSVRLVKSL